MNMINVRYDGDAAILADSNEKLQEIVDVKE